MQQQYHTHYFLFKLLGLCFLATPCVWADSAQQHAQQASAAMRPLTRTPRSDLYKIALYIEQQLPEAVQRGKSCFPAKKTGLPAHIHHDAKSKQTFITFNRILATGHYKNVKEALLYDRTHPQRLVAAIQRKDMEREAQMTMELSDMAGIMKAYAHHKHDGQDILYLKRYNLGSGDEALKKRRMAISKNQRIGVALQLAHGLSALHSKGYVHRDLTMRNFILHKEGGKITAAIADLGRARKFADLDESNPAGNTYYIAPEGLVRSEMQGAAYKGTDIYALGCIFYRLIHGHMGSWQNQAHKLGHGSAASAWERKDILERSIVSATFGRLRALNRRKRLTPYQQFEKLSLQMLNPNPNKRGTAQQIRSKLQQIARRVKATQSSARREKESHS